MRHGSGYSRLGMKSSLRLAVLRNMATSLVLNEKIQTTVARAKEVRRLVDKLITLGKRGDLHARRQVASIVYDDAATVKIFSELSKRHKDRPGGYTRILKLGTRQGDGAEIASLELVDAKSKAAAETPKAKEKTPAVKAKAKAEPKKEKA